MIGNAKAVMARMVFLLLRSPCRTSSQFVFIRQGGLEASELRPKYAE